MNPVLLKPGSDQRSHVVVNGQPAGTISSAEFIGGRTHLAETAFAAFDDLASRFDVVVCEGAGSPAEINLRAGDYTNMGLARHADMPVVVVGDIDRGGVFASLFGTVALLDAADQRLVAGFIINKFRGNDDLARARARPADRTDRPPTYGVLPWSPDVWLDSEDALDLASAPVERRRGRSARRRRCGCRGSATSPTSTPSASSPASRSSWSPTRASIAGVDLVVLPGTRATMADLSLAALPRARPRHRSPTSTRVVRCSASAVGSRCSAGRSSDPDGVEGVRGAGGRRARPARRHDDVRAGQGAAGSMTTAPTRSTTAASTSGMSPTRADGARDVRDGHDAARRAGVGRDARNPARRRWRPPVGQRW